MWRFRTLAFLATFMLLSIAYTYVIRDAQKLNRANIGGPAVTLTSPKENPFGMKSTWSEEAIMLGRFRLLSEGVLERGHVRVVSFEDMTGRHHEAFIECEPPWIENGWAVIYARVRRATNKIRAYYLACRPKAAADPSPR